MTVAVGLCPVVGAVPVHPAVIRVADGRVELVQQSGALFGQHFRTSASQRVDHAVIPRRSCPLREGAPPLELCLGELVLRVGATPTAVAWRRAPDSPLLLVCQTQRHLIDRNLDRVLAILHAITPQRPHLVGSHPNPNLVERGGGG